MKCSLCGSRDATIRIQQVVGDDRIEASLCERCAREQGIKTGDEEIEISISGLLSSLTDLRTCAKPETMNRTCPHCGLTYEELKKTLKVGCPECYTVFSREVRGYMRRHYGAAQHVGKYPKSLVTYKTFLVDAERLRRRLKDAVAREEYEKAAELRDRIRHLEDPQEGG